jgi:hypothetical protein
LFAVTTCRLLINPITNLVTETHDDDDDDDDDDNNSTNRTMTPESTQPITEMSTRNLPGGIRRPARKADNLTAICEAIV